MFLCPMLGYLPSQPANCAGSSALEASKNPVVSLSLHCKKGEKKKTVRATMDKFVGGWLGGWMGGCVGGWVAGWLAEGVTISYPFDR